MSELRKFVIENTEIHSDQQVRLVNQVDRLIAINAELLTACEALNERMQTGLGYDRELVAFRAAIEKAPNG